MAALLTLAGLGVAVGLTAGAVSGATQTYQATHAKTPVDPRKRAIEIANLQKFSGQSRLEGTSSTLLTGQTGVTGQPKVNRPTLLGG